MRSRKSGKPFVQWEKSSMSAYRRLMNESAKAAEMLTILVENMNNTNAVVISQKALMELLNVKTRNSIIKYTKVLVSENWVSVLKIGNCNVYHINRTCFWQETRNKKFYSQMNANVILSAEEQDKSINELKQENKLHYLPKVEDVDSITINDNEDPPSQEEMNLMSPLSNENRDPNTIDLVDGKTDIER